MAATWRKRRGSDTWHFCFNCSRWPTYDYDETTTKPTDGELCDECNADKAENDCA